MKMKIKNALSTVYSIAAILVMVIYLILIWWGISTSLKSWEHVYTWPPRWWAPGMTTFFCELLRP